jgi:poly(A) polymerase
MARAARAGLRSVPTGVDHGTVTLVVQGRPFEVTTLREDVETDGRRARVRFGRSFEHDARRRDFTMNALSTTATGEIFDYVDGLADLAARRVRFIGEPRQRIREDYLRILRFFRFHAAYGAGAMDAEAFDAVIAERAGLASLSRERVRAELMKLLVAARAAAVVEDICDAGLLQPLLAGVCRPARLAHCAAIEAARGAPPDATLRFIALCVATREDAERLLERLRLSNAEAARAAGAADAHARLHARSAPPQPRELYAFLYERGRAAACDAIALAHAESGAAADDERWLSAWRFLRDTPEPRLPFSGADLLARGLPAGRRIGETLKRLQALWIRAGFPKDAATLAHLLDEATNRADG